MCRGLLGIPHVHLIPLPEGGSLHEQAFLIFVQTLDALNQKA